VFSGKGRPHVAAGLRRSLTRWVVLALAPDAALAITDAVTGRAAILTTVYRLAPLALAQVERGERVAAVAAVSTALALASGVWNHYFATGEHVYRLVIVAGSGVLAVVGAQLRVRALTGRDRMRLLAEVGQIADGRLALDDWLSRLGDVLVPAAADFYEIVTLDGKGSGAPSPVSRAGRLISSGGWPPARSTRARSDSRARRSSAARPSSSPGLTPSISRPLGRAPPIASCSASCTCARPRTSRFARRAGRRRCSRLPSVPPVAAMRTMTFGSHGRLARVPAGDRERPADGRAAGSAAPDGGDRRIAGRRGDHPRALGPAYLRQRGRAPVDGHHLGRRHHRA
jgi:hypothetical protein